MWRGGKTVVLITQPLLLLFKHIVSMDFLSREFSQDLEECNLNLLHPLKSERMALHSHYHCMWQHFAENEKKSMTLYIIIIITPRRCAIITFRTRKLSVLSLRCRPSGRPEEQKFPRCRRRRRRHCCRHRRYGVAYEQGSHLKRGGTILSNHELSLFMI